MRRGRPRRAPALALGLALGLAFLPASGHAEDFLVLQLEEDDPDTDPGDGLCRSGPAATSCTFRAAVEEANALSGRDEIVFAHNGVVTLELDPELGPLPPIDDLIEIDGRTAQSYDRDAPKPRAPSPQYFLDGSALPPGNSDGLLFLDGSDGSRVLALGILGFPDEGIQTRPGADGIVVQGCWIGVMPGGVTGLGNGRAPVGDTAGILLQSDGNSIGQVFAGGAFHERRNVVSGNHEDGIAISDGDDNRLRGNLVGLAGNGGVLLPNGGWGVRVIAGTDNGIGGFPETASAGNAISGNEAGGVRIEDAGNFLRANFIGTAPGGALGAPNRGNGVDLLSSGNVVGGAPDTARNHIARNEGYGLRIGSSAEDVSANDNLVLNNQVGGPPAGNDEAGILVAQGTRNSLRDNLVGENAGGGIRIHADGNEVQGNLVGTDSEGADLGNAFDGIGVVGRDNRIGGTLPGTGNVVGFNESEGIVLTDGNVVQGNHVGTNFAGDDLGNGGSGIFVVSGGNRIGGDEAGARNVVSGNGGDGILLGEAASSNVVQGNFVGTNPAATDPLGNAGAGVHVASSSVNNIGRANPDFPNVISGNASHGIHVSGEEAAGNAIAGNLIGVGIDGETAVGNGGHGVRLSDGAHDNAVGSGPEGGNVIAHNAGVGVSVRGPSVDNEIEPNAIFGNGLPIDLGEDGPTGNDEGDADSGPNRLQNFPVIESFELGGDPNEVEIAYEVPSDPEHVPYPLTVRFFVADGRGGARAFVGEDTYRAADAASGRTASLVSLAAVTGEELLVASATDALGSTSELTFVPEPSGAGAAGLLGVLLLAARRRPGRRGSGGASPVS